jgi:hypothetical protein
MSDNGSIEQSPITRLIRGQYGLALTYWLLYLIVAVAFFIAGSMAVAEGAWSRYVAMLAATVTWTFILLTGIKRAYTGEDPGKALGRIAMLFLLLNMSNALATLSFI